MHETLLTFCTAPRRCRVKNNLAPSRNALRPPAVLTRTVVRPPAGARVPSVGQGRSGRLAVRVQPQGQLQPPDALLAFAVAQEQRPPFAPQGRVVRAAPSPRCGSRRAGRGRRRVRLHPVDRPRPPRRPVEPEQAPVQWRTGPAGRRGAGPAALRSSGSAAAGRPWSSSTSPRSHSVSPWLGNSASRPSSSFAAASAWPPARWQRASPSRTGGRSGHRSASHW